MAEWAQIMLNYNKHGENAITLYNYLEDSNQLMRHLGARAGDLSPHINKHGPCHSAVSCTSSSHPDNYQTHLSRLGGAAIAAAILPPVPILQQVIITSSNETKDKNNMAVGYHTLLTILIYAEYDPKSYVLSDLNFPAPTEACKRVSMLATKDERVHVLKHMLDTNNSLRVPGSEHHMLIMSRDYDDVDPLVPTAIITGSQNRDQRYEVHLHPVHSHPLSCHWKKNRDRPPQRMLSLPA